MEAATAIATTTAEAATAVETSTSAATPTVTAMLGKSRYRCTN
jgi:hypothetical protein